MKLIRRTPWVLGGAVLLLVGLAAFAWFVSRSSRTIGVIEGNVVEVAGERVVIEAQREAQVGDPVKIYFAIPGFDELGTVGSGSVVEGAGTRVTATIERRSGDLAVGQIAKIGEVPAGPVRAPPGEASEEPSLPAGGTGGAQFLGCFKDTSDFDLDGHLERSRTNTPQSCIATCRGMGFRYAGLQYGESCLCGNSYGRYGRAENCSYVCTGDPSQVCGGYSSNSVYATGSGGPKLHPPPPPHRR